MTYTCLARHIKRLFLLVTSLSLIGCKTITVTERDLLLPDQRVDAAAAERRQEVERFTVPTEYGDISVTRIHRAGNRVTVLYFGGNQFRTSQSGGDVVRAFPIDADLILFDYPGYGDSTGVPTLASMQSTSVAVYDAVKFRNPQPILVYGASIGGFMAVHVAGARNPPRLLLEGTAPDARQWMASLIPWFARPFVRIRLSDSIANVDNVQRLSLFEGPILMMVGSRDTQTRPKLMRSFAAVMRTRGNEVLFVEIDDRGHGQLLDVERVRSVIADFVMQESMPRDATTAQESAP